MTTVKPMMYADTDDKDIVQLVEFFASFSKEVQLYNEDYLKDYKRFANGIRKSLKSEYSDKLLGFALIRDENGNGKSVRISIYNVEATEENHYQVSYKDNVACLDLSKGL